jgi:O-antigen/teichoic acid export membrane protein
LSPTQVGVFAVGMEIATLPATEVVDPICRACMPGFAAALRSGSTEEVAEAYLRILALIALLVLPAGIGISLVAGPVVALGFGQDWLAAVPVVAVLGAAWTLTLFGNVSSALLNARAMLRTLMVIAALSAAARLPLMPYFITHHALTGAAIATAIIVVAEHSVLMACALRLLRLPVLRLLRCVLRPALATAAMALVMWSAGMGWAPAPASAGTAALALLQGVALGLASYAAALGALWTLAGYPPGAEADLLNLLRRSLGRLGMGRRLGTLRGS